MSSVSAIGRQLVDVSAILVLGFVYVVVLSLGTAGTYVWDSCRTLTRSLSASERTVEEDPPSTH
jgi:hypothetical protein